MEVAEGVGMVRDVPVRLVRAHLAGQHLGVGHQGRGSPAPTPQVLQVVDRLRGQSNTTDESITHPIKEKYKPRERNDPF